MSPSQLPEEVGSPLLGERKGRRLFQVAEESKVVSYDGQVMPKL